MVGKLSCGGTEEDMGAIGLGSSINYVVKRRIRRGGNKSNVTNLYNV